MAFRYPPYNMANLAKMRVPMTVSFKKGETMEEQQILNTDGNMWNTAVVGAVVIALSGVVWQFFT
jgi:hypothetical protein